MKTSQSEQLNLAIVHGSQAYHEWEKEHQLSDYLTFVLYELLLRQKLTQTELVQLTALPKQSINKGINFLHRQDYLELKQATGDKRQKICQLTRQGEAYARRKLSSLFSLENEVADKMGAQKMTTMIKLTQEWGSTFWRLLNEEESQK